MREIVRNMAGLTFAAVIVGSSLPTPTHAEEDNTPVQTIQGAEPGARAKILSLKRTEGGLLTLRIAFENATGGEIKNKALPGAGNVENFQLVDFIHKRKYSVLRTTDGACLCTSLNPFNSLEPGTRVLWAKFTAPADTVSKISLLLPDAEPVDGIPISK
jgi:hypothetical protein